MRIAVFSKWASGNVYEDSCFGFSVDSETGVFGNRVLILAYCVGSVLEILDRSREFSEEWYFCFRSQSYGEK